MRGRGPAALGAATLFFLGGLVMAPARGAAPTPAAAPAGSLPLPAIVGVTRADGTVDVAYPGLDRGALIDLYDPATGPVGALDVTRAALANEHGMSLPDLHPESSLSSSSTAATGVVALMSATTPAGDLNGDGLDDVLLYRWQENSDMIEVAAHSGTDGSELWRRPPADFDDGIAFPVTDVTGDGRTDLFRLWLTDAAVAVSTHSCQPVGCREERREATFMWRYGVVSGADGADLWEQSAQGHFLYTDRTWSEGLVTRSTKRQIRVQSVNDLIFISPAGDHDDNGADDIVLNLLDLAWQSDEEENTTLVLTESYGSGVGTSTTRASVLDGHSGGVIFERTAEARPAYGFLRSTPQLVGDATPDLAWSETEVSGAGYECEGVDLVVTSDYGCEGTYSERRHVVTIVDGATLEEAWTSRSGLLEYGGMAVAPDVTGDGVPDVAQLMSDYDVLTTRFLDGPTGAELWRAPGVPLVMGAALGGEATADVLMAQTDVYSLFPTTSITLDRIEGATGAALFSSTTVLDPQIDHGSYVTFAVTPVDNAGASPAPDVLMYLGRAAFDEDSSDAGTHTVIEDGLGAVLLSEHVDALRMRYVIPDLDGDGLNDALDAHYEHREEYWSEFVLDRMQRLVDDATLWAVPAGTWVSVAGEQDGAPGQEVLTGSYDGTNVVSSVSGATGATRWTITF